MAPAVDLLNHLPGVDTSIQAFNLEKLSEDNNIDFRIILGQINNDKIDDQDVLKVKGYRRPL